MREKTGRPLIFEHLDEWQSLSASATENDACELHGLCCGLLAVIPGKSADDLLQMMEPLGEWEWDAKVRQHLQNAILEAAAAMDSEDFSFSPILPPDDQQLRLRTECLGAWCAGFIAGVGAGRGDQTSVEAEGNKATQKNSKQDQADLDEIIADFAQISRASVDAGEAHGESEDELELAFSELVEYVRTGAMLIRQGRLIALKDKA